MKFLLIVWSLLSLSNTSEIKGRVEDSDGKAIPFANILIVDHGKGTAANEHGEFLISNLSSGSYELKISALGYQQRQIKIDLQEGQPVDLGAIVLQEDMLGLNEVVITGSMRETFVKASPVKVEVIKASRIMNHIPATNLMDGLQMMNGLQEVNACGVCNTNSISINGLPGQYTAVLMDGSPIYGNLAAVYGLNGIPTQMVDRIEVIKGPASTLYGSEAIGGVVNIITKKPELEPKISIDLMGTSHTEGFTNIAAASKLGRWSQFSGINAAYLNRYEDQNNDGFGDMVAMDRLSLFSKWQMKRTQNRQFTIAAKVYYEDRRNGVKAYLKDRAYKKLRGSDSIYGESIYTLRSELFGTYEMPVIDNFRVDYSLSWHDQDSYYGSTRYTANQGIAFANFIYTMQKKKHLLTAGMTQRLQYYDDNTIATNEAFNDQSKQQYIPGVFLEAELKISPRFTALGGVRLDHYSNHGLIPAPRLSLKLDADEYTAIRLTSGRGFKIVSLFTEDHAFVTGQRIVELKESLKPEQSWNASANLNHVHAWWNTSGSLDFDVFYTQFTNKIAPDYSQPGKIIYANSDGFAHSYGAAGNFSMQFTFPLALTVGVNYNRAEIQQQGSLNRLPFAPEWSGVLTANYAFTKYKMTIAYTANFTGIMTLPEVFDLNEHGEPEPNPRPTESKPFSVHNLQLTKIFGRSKQWELYGGVQNIFDFRQVVSPLVGYNDPNAQPGFSPFFDTSYAYASLHGREVFVGIRLKVNR